MALPETYLYTPSVSRPADIADKSEASDNNPDTGDRTSTYSLQQSIASTPILPTVPPALDPIDIDPEDIIEPPTVDDVTEEILSGNGVFDIYMRAGSNQLQSQYDAGRIKGAEYANAYMNMMELMMSQANGFVLQIFDSQMKAKMFPYQMAEIKYKAALYAYQAMEMESKVKLAELQYSEMKLNGPLERNIKRAQAEQTENQTALIKKQIHEVVSKTETNYQQVAELKANGAVERTLKASQIGVQEQQAQLYERQMKGFDDKNRNDAFKTVMDAWAVQSVEIEEPEDQKVPNLWGSRLDGKVAEVLSSVGL